MEKQLRKSLISKLLCFIPKLVKEQTPNRDEFKTQPIKAILRILLMILGIVFCLLLTGIVLGLYLIIFILKILGTIFLFGAVADFVNNRE